MEQGASGFQKVRCLAEGISAALSLSFQYAFPAFPERDASPYAQVNALLSLSKWFHGYGLLWGITGLGLAYFFFRTREQIFEKEQKQFRGLAGISLLFGFLNTMGLCMHYVDALPFFLGGTAAAASLLVIFGWACLFYYAAAWILRAMEEVRSGEAASAQHGNEGTEWICDRKLFLLSLLVILAFWLPWMITYYPASMDNDVFFQLDTVLGYIPKSNHHPWFSSRLLAGFYSIGRGFGSDNIGIFLYVAVRNFLMALIYSRGIVLLKRTGIRKQAVLLAVLFYAVSPVWGAYSKHAFKDTLAAGAFFWYVFSLTNLILQERAGKDTLRHWAEAGSAACLAVLVRNNFIYAVFPTVLMAALPGLKKKQALKASVLAAGLALGLLYQHCIFTYGGVQKGAGTEALSIPLQQTARVVAVHGDDMPAQEKKEISRFWDFEKLKEAYDPIISDPVKGSFRLTKGVSGKDYLLLWAVMFPEYPREYIEAALAQSYGYYAFTPKRGYWEGNWNSNMVYFHWIGTNSYPSEAFHFSYIPALELPRQLLAKWADLWDTIPVLSLTDTIAAYTWMIVLIGYFLLRQRRFRELIPVLAAMILILTCVASPVNDCFRYYAPVAVALPVLLAGALAR